MSSSGTLKHGEALGALTYLYQEAQKLQPINCETISGQDHANFMSGITLRGWSSEFILWSFDLPWGFLIFRVYFCAALAITLSWLMWQTWHFTTCVCFCFSKEHFVRWNYLWDQKGVRVSHFWCREKINPLWTPTFQFLAQCLILSIYVRC